MGKTERQVARSGATRAKAAAVLLAASAAGVWAGERQMSSPPAGQPMSRAPAETADPAAAAPINRCEAGPGMTGAAAEPGNGQKCGVMTAGEQVMQLPVIAARTMQAMMNAMATAAERAQEAVRRSQGQ